MDNIFAGIKEIDFYGKEPEFYLNRRPKKVTIIGRIFTIIYILLYFVFFGYKLIRLFKRTDLSFYDSDSEGSESLSFHMTKEDFYFNFAFIDSETGLAFLDETIYQPYAFFNDDPVEIKPCTIDKVGSEYVRFFDEPNLDQYYCFQEFDFTLQAYVDSFYIQIIPCKNSSENNYHCKPQEVIDDFINGNDMTVRLQDVLVTPKNYSNPVERRITDVYSYLFKNIGQYIYIEIQITNIETNTNIIGFDFLTEEKSETYIRYDLVSTVPTPGYQDSDFPIAEIEIQLKDKYFTEKRIYPQLFDVLGEVGGFMEAISSFFGLITSFIVNILYQNTITNSLFSFDLQRKEIKIKKDEKTYKYKLQDISDRDEIKKNKEKTDNLNLNKNLKNSSKNIVNDKNTNLSLKSINEEAIFKNKGKNNDEMNSGKIFINKKRKQKRSINKIESDKSIVLYNSKKSNDINIIKEKENNKNIDSKINDEYIINDIPLNQLYVHLGFCCLRCKKDLSNILLDESQFLLAEKLDIINIFKNICLTEEIQNKYELKNDNIYMSDKCKLLLE